MENNISNKEQIRKKFEEIFSYGNNKNVFLDYLYGKSKNCPTCSTLHYFYGIAKIYGFYFDENTSKEDKEVIQRYAKFIMINNKSKNLGMYFSAIVSLLAGDELEKALIENYNITPKYGYSFYQKYSKYYLKNNEGYKYIEIQVNNFYSFLNLENSIPKEFNQCLQKIKNNSKILLKKEPHLLLIILVYLINRDDDKSLIKQLLNYIDSLKINEEETTALLFTIVDKNEEVFRRLMNILNKDNNMIYFLKNISLEMKQAIKLYERLFKNTFIYSADMVDEYLKICNFPKECLLLNTIINDENLSFSDRIAKFKKLYDKDREAFYKTYDIIEKSKLEYLYLDYVMLSLVILLRNDNKYNIDTNSIVENLKKIFVELLKTKEPIKNFDDIISKSIKYLKDYLYVWYSIFLLAIMYFDEINDEASEITTKLLKYYGIYGAIYDYISIQETFYNRNILEAKEKLVNDKKVPLKYIYIYP